MFAREPPAFEEPAQGRHPDLQVPPLLELGTELCPRGLRLLVDQVAPQGQGGWGAGWLTSARVGPRRARLSRAPPPRLQDRRADAEQGRQGPWRAALVVVGLQDFLSEVERRGVHAGSWMS